MDESRRSRRLQALTQPSATSSHKLAANSIRPDQHNNPALSGLSPDLLYFTPRVQVGFNANNINHCPSDSESFVEVQPFDTASSFNGSYGYPEASHLHDTSSAADGFGADYSPSVAFSYPFSSQPCDTPTELISQYGGSQAHPLAGQQGNSQDAPKQNLNPPPFAATSIEPPEQPQVMPECFANNQKATAISEQAGNQYVSQGPNHQEPFQVPKGYLLIRRTTFMEGLQNGCSWNKLVKKAAITGELERFLHYDRELRSDWNSDSITSDSYTQQADLDGQYIPKKGVIQEFFNSFDATLADTITPRNGQSDPLADPLADSTNYAQFELRANSRKGDNDNYQPLCEPSTAEPLVEGQCKYRINKGGQKEALIDNEWVTFGEYCGSVLDDGRKCTMFFTSTRELNKHQKEHGEAQSQCCACTYRTNRGSNLKRHVFTAHPELFIAEYGMAAYLEECAKRDKRERETKAKSETQKRTRKKEPEHDSRHTKSRKSHHRPDDRNEYEAVPSRSFQTDSGVSTAMAEGHSFSNDMQSMRQPNLDQPFTLRQSAAGVAMHPNEGGYSSMQQTLAGSYAGGQEGFQQQLCPNYHNEHGCIEHVWQGKGCNGTYQQYRRRV